MKTWYVNIFVEKLLKKKWKLVYAENIETMLSRIMGENYTRTKAYKLIHQAKNKGHIFSLKKDVYYVTQGQETEWDIIERFYWEILHNHIKEYMDGKGLITWTVALQLLLQNYEIPDVVSLISPNKQCVETIVRDKKIAIKKMNAGNESLFTTLKKTARKIWIHKKTFATTSLSVSLLEALYSATDNTILTNELCRKILRKHWKHLDRDEIIALLRKGKYHTSINKLYHIARGIDDAYARHIVEIIKKHSYRMSL